MFEILKCNVLDLPFYAQQIVFCIRLVFALLCSGLLGYERAVRFKEAGIRTHCIVGIASATLMILSKYGFGDIMQNYDPGRIAAQIVAGIGFIGTAIVFRQGQTVRGLTTAAGIWATAAVGMLFGSGLYVMGFMVTILLLLVLLILHHFNLANDSFMLTEISVIMDNDENVMELVKKLVDEHDSIIMHSNLSYLSNNQLKYDLVLRNKKTFTYEEIQLFLKNNSNVHSISI